MATGPETSGDPDGERAASRGMTAMDEMSEAWARGFRLTEAVQAILNKPDAAVRVEELAKLAWGSGAYAAVQRMSPDEIEEFARGD